MSYAFPGEIRKRLGGSTMSPIHSFEYELDEESSARATEVFIRGQCLKAPVTAKQWRAMGVLLICALVSGALLTLGYWAELPIGILFIPGAFLGLFGGVLSLAIFAIVTGALVAWPARWVIRRRLLAQVPDSYDQKVHWTLTEQEFHVHTASKDYQLPWEQVRRFLADSEFWFLGIQNGPDLILPVEKLPNEVRELIRSKTANLPVTVAKTVNHSGNRATAVVRPDTESASLELIAAEGARQRLIRKPWFGQFLKVTVATGVTLFLLQEGYLGVPRQQVGNLWVIVALALGAGCVLVLLVKRRHASPK
jgi:hypothetical protein